MYVANMVRGTCQWICGSLGVRLRCVNVITLSMCGIDSNMQAILQV